MIVALLSLLLLIQSPSGTPVRLGYLGPLLTDDDIGQIDRLVADYGKRPWLVDGNQGQIWDPGGDGWAIWVYLQPTQVTPDVRRGDAVYIRARVAVPNGPRVWRPVYWSAHAQVLVPGRSFDDIRSNDDVNRPFFDDLEFDSAELANIVHFARSEPSLAAARDLRILEVRRSRDARGNYLADEYAQVNFLGPKATMILRLKRLGQTYSVLSYEASTVVQ